MFTMSRFYLLYISLAMMLSEVLSQAQSPLHGELPDPPTDPSPTGPCEPNPCHPDNSGICVELGDVLYECPCHIGYTGQTCETNINECASSPCLHGAKCVDLIGGYICHCHDKGYTGTHCETDINECASNPCGAFPNTIGCVDLVKKFKCQCEPGYTGTSCETNVNECASSPCLHGTKCVDLINGYICHCHENGYRGTHCETEINECESSPCHAFPNTAGCIDKLNNFTCECEPGYTGARCETIISNCNLSACQHGGQCEDLAVGYICHCDSGYTGPNCETDVDECSPVPCHAPPNSVGCVDGVDSYTCECATGYTGVHCETKIIVPSSLSDSDHGYYEKEDEGLVGSKSAESDEPEELKKTEYGYDQGIGGDNYQADDDNKGKQKPSSSYKGRWGKSRNNDGKPETSDEDEVEPLKEEEVQRKASKDHPQQKSNNKGEKGSKPRNEGVRKGKANGSPDNKSTVKGGRGQDEEEYQGQPKEYYRRE